MKKPTDIETARNKRLPRATFIDLPDDDDPATWLSRLSDDDGEEVVRCGIEFGFEGRL